MNTFDLEEFIDRAPFGATQRITLFVCVMICFIDGFDLVLLGKIAPAIAKDFGETSAAMTRVFVYQQIGLAIGAFVISPLADRLGRRAMLILCCFFLGLTMLGSMYVHSLHMLAIMRGIAGIFMAACLPIAMTLISELTPASRRSTLVAVALGGYSVGSAATAFVAAWLLDDYGWESGFIIGGIVPLLCVPLLIFFVPESLKLRAERNPTDKRIAQSLRRLDPKVTLRGDETFVLSSGNAKGTKARLSDIFSEGRFNMTVMLWTAYTLSVVLAVLLGTWLPSFFQEMANIPIQEFAMIALIGYLGGVTGPLVIGWLMDRIQPALLLAGCYLLLVICINLLAWIPFHSMVFVLVIVVWSFTQSGGQGGLKLMMTHLYPPRMRSTALGWAGGAGRIGAVIAPIAGGYALAQQYSLQFTMAMVAVLPCGILVIMIILAVARHRQAPGNAPLATQ